MSESCKHNELILIVLEKIHTDYSKDISLSTLSNQIYVNKNKLAKSFKNITGYTVTEYIINYRIKCACAFLETTDVKINEIAKECGFVDKAYFTKQFKKYIGMTPTEYRNSKCKFQKGAIVIQNREKRCDNTTTNRN